MTADPITEPHIDTVEWQQHQWKDERGARQFDALSFEGLFNDVSANSPVIANTIWSDSLQVLVGPANVGKSAVATAAALSITQKLSFLGREHCYSHVGFKPAILAGEAIGNVRNQVMAWDIHHGDRLGDSDLITVPKTIDFSDHKLAARLGNWLGEEEVGLVVIDPLINFIGRGDENDSSQMAAVMRGIRIMTAELWSPNLVIVVHHANQSGGIRGSRVIRDLADVVYLVSADGPSGVKLKRDKNRFGPVEDVLHARLKHVSDPASSVDSVVAMLSQNGLRQLPRLSPSHLKTWDTIRDSSETRLFTKPELSKLFISQTGIARAGSYRAIGALVEAGNLIESSVNDVTVYSVRSEQ